VSLERPTDPDRIPVGQALGAFGDAITRIWPAGDEPPQESLEEAWSRIFSERMPPCLGRMTLGGLDMRAMGGGRFIVERPGFGPSIHQLRVRGAVETVLDRRAGSLRAVAEELVGGVLEMLGVNAPREIPQKPARR
jgi:hypothetical protein